MFSLFHNLLKTTKVRNGVYAYTYSNGVHCIGEQKYLDMAVTEAIRRYRLKLPVRKRK